MLLNLYITSRGEVFFMKKLSQYLKKNYKKVVGWGTSKYYKETSNKLDIALEYLIDSDEKKYGSKIDDKIINMPEVLKKEDPNEVLIVVFSSFYKEICEKIKSFGDFCTINGEELINFALHLEMKEKNNLNMINQETIITISRNNFALYLGGTSKFIREQMELIYENRYTHLHLFWKDYDIKGFRGVFFSVVIDGKEVGFYELNDIFKHVSKLKALVIHNLIDMNLGALDSLLERVSPSIPIYYYMHDFSGICSNIKLMYNDETFCRGYDNNWEFCTTCESYEAKELIYDYHKLLFSKETVKLIAPSENTKEIMCKAFNLQSEKIRVIPHQQFLITRRKKEIINQKIKIAYVGYKHKHKGWETFKQIVSDFKDQYDFYCFGSSDEILDGVKHVEVSFIEDGEIAMTKKLTEYEIDVSFLWSLWPETYSYTYYESSAAGTFVITNVLSGNIYDQVIKNRNGVTLRDYQELAGLLDNEDELRNLLMKNEIVFTNLRKNKEGILELINTKA